MLNFSADQSVAFAVIALFNWIGVHVASANMQKNVKEYDINI